MSENVAARPMRVAAPMATSTPARSGLLQRKCACGGIPGPDGECAACRARRLARRRATTALTDPATAPPVVHEVLRGAGQPLDAAARDFLEPRFGHDFSHVRVHADARAAASARAVGAQAYTVGRNVVFGAGQYAPGTAQGRRLLAHELTHVVQQAGGHAAAQGELAVGAPGDAAEREADEIARQVVGASPRVVAGPARVQPLLQRACGPALGPPAPDCMPDTSEPPGEVFYFDVNCDTLKPASAAYLSGAFTTTLTALPAGSTLKVHGFASEEGPEPFNRDLSCHRANRVASVVRASAPIAGVFKHGGVPGAAD